MLSNGCLPFSWISKLVAEIFSPKNQPSLGVRLDEVHPALPGSQTNDFAQKARFGGETFYDGVSSTINRI